MKKEDWEDIEKGFRHRWDYPHCFGAIDGKHVVVECPPNSGSDNFNYKGQFSINLMAMVNHTYKFTYVYVGSPGSNSDGAVLRNAKFGRALFEEKLDVPDAQEMPYCPDLVLPFVVVADEAFPLSPNLMRPYPKIRNAIIPWDQQVYNYRHSRARRIVENAFSILTARWCIYTRRICLNPSNAVAVVLATVALHNYLTEDKTYEVIMNELCAGGQPLPAISLQDIRNLRGYRANEESLAIRDGFKHYFNNHGALDWQENLILQRQGLDSTNY